MEFTQCPYDSSPIKAEPCADRTTLLSCPTCGAAWQLYRTWLRRLGPPDRDAVRAARAGLTPEPVAHGVPDPATVSTMWSRITS
jgi:hypothetical protein